MRDSRAKLGQGAEARFAKLTPGEYVLCATRLGDMAKRGPSCRSVRVDALPAVQELTLD